MGWFTINMPFDFDWTVLDVDRLVEFWRAPPGGNLQWEMTGFLRKWNIARRRNRTAVTLEGPGQMHLLDNRIIAYKGGQAESEKSGPADDVMKAFVREALGSLAGNDPYGRTRIQENFTVSADVGDGQTMETNVEWQELMRVLQDISDHAHSKGTPIYFDVVQTSPANFEFRTYKNQRGIDRTSGPNALTFGEEFGNLTDPSWEEDWTKERNIIYGGGQGVDQDRVIDPEKDLARLHRTRFNRREAFQDARGEDTTLGVAKKAFARLIKDRPRRRLSGKMLSVPGSLYGENWRFGDKVLATAFGQQFEGMPRSISIQVLGKGREVITARIEADLVIIP